VLNGGFNSETNGGDLDDLEQALHQVRHNALSCLSALELADRACALRRVASQLEAIETATLAVASNAVEGPGAFKTLGFRHAVDYVIDGTKADGRQVRRLTRTGTWLLDFPVFAEAFADGVLTHRHVLELSKLDKPCVHHHLVESQEMLVNAAKECDFSDFVNVLIYWLNAADPDGEEPCEQPTRSGCTYRKHSDGSVSGKFWFDPLMGQAFRRLIDVESQRLFRHDTEHSVRRSAGRRQGAALLNLMVRGSESGGDSSITPLINLVMGQDLAENLIARLAGNTTDVVEPDHEDINRRCELDDGTPIHPNLAAVALAAGRFRRMVFNSKSRPVDLASKARSFPPWMKQVLLIQARGRCQIPGCDAPFSWLQADHVKAPFKGRPSETYQRADPPTTFAPGKLDASADGGARDPHNKSKRDE